jgi:hypothetical protein
MTMAALVSVVPAALAGQAEQAASAWRAQACEQALETTAGAGAHDAEWRRSLAYLSACGRAGGAVLARELARLESSSDVDELTQSYRAISHIRDAQVFEAALELVGDASATPESRIVAFKVLITLHDPSRASLSISSFLPGSQPDFMRQDHHAVSDGELLPADWSQRTRTRIGEVVEDADESEPMRFAAGRAVVRANPISASRWGPRAWRVWWVPNTRWSP